MAAMRTAGVFLVLLTLARAVGAQILETEVWVGPLDLSGGGFVVGELTNISNHAGYDNQPSFGPDGSWLLFTQEADSLDTSGNGVHAVRYELRSGKSTLLPLARGFSPTPAENGSRLLLLREGAVWLHDAQGRKVRKVVETTEAGYFARFDDRTWALFMNDKERRIVLYDAATKTLETMDKGAITAPYRIPEIRAVSYVVQEGEKKTLRRLDLATKKVNVLTEIALPTGGHHVWLSRGSILFASGNTIVEWTPTSPERFVKIHEFSHPDLQGITRIAISPQGDRIAIVSTARGETTVRNARLLANRATAEALRNDRNARYVRTIESVEMRDDGATERGTWYRRWRTAQGPVELRGRYTSVWTRTIGGNGAPSWELQSENTTE
jgi:hypothetical protein